MAKQNATPTHPVLDNLAKSLKEKGIPVILTDKRLEVLRSGRDELKPKVIISDRVLVQEDKDGNFIGSYEGIHPGLNEENVSPEKAVDYFKMMTSVFKRGASYNEEAKNLQLQR